MRIRAGFPSLRLATMVVLAACSVLTSAERPSTTAEDSMQLKSFLQDYLKVSHTAGGNTTRYFAAFVDLKDGGKRQVIVYFTDQPSCGSGGCTTLILAPEGSSYKVIASITIVWPPIRILNTKSNGWRDIGVWVQGGGIQPGYEAQLSFDGKTYPSNPSMPPARRLVTEVAGEVVVPRTAEGTPLYP